MVQFRSNSRRWCEHTLGMGAWPLNRLLTALSIPLGFLQLGSTHLKRSLWWRLKRAVPAFPQLNQQLSNSQTASSLRAGSAGNGATAVRSTAVCVCGCWARGIDVRFLTIGTCFLAATICAQVSVWAGSMRGCSGHGVRTLSAGVVERVSTSSSMSRRKVWSCEIDVGAGRRNWFRRRPTSERTFGDRAKPH